MKNVTVYSQPGWIFCTKVKEFLSQNQIEYVEKNIAIDERAVSELEHLGYMTTPVTLVNEDVVVGFDVPKLKALLSLPEDLVGKG